MSGAWPLVADDDDGIRPAGAPDECFYCKNKVGQPHSLDCVVVTKRIEMRVRAQLLGGNIVTGLWQFEEPYAWDVGMSESHKNKSTWCAGNFLRERYTGNVRWDTGNPWPDLIAICSARGCLCSRVSFEFVRIVDATPRRKLRARIERAMN